MQRTTSSGMGRHATDKVQRTTGSSQRAAEILLLQATGSRRQCSRQPTTMHTTTRSSEACTIMFCQWRRSRWRRNARPKGRTPRGPHLILPLGCHWRLPLSHTIPLCQLFHARVCACVRACVREKTTFCSRHRAEDNNRQERSSRQHCGRPHAASNVQQTTMQRTTCSRHHAEDIMQKTSCRRQHAADTTPQTPCN